MHIVLIHQAFASEQQAGGTRHFELSKYLAARGHRVTIIASPISYLTGSASHALSSAPGVEVISAWTYAPKTSGFFVRLLNFFSFMATSFLAGVRTRKTDVVWGTSPPIFQALSAFIVAKLRRKPFLLEIRDLWPDFAIEVGVLTNPLLIRASRWLERLLCLNAERVVINSPGFRDHLVSIGVEPQRTTLVSNGVELRDFTGVADRDAVRERWGYGDRFVVTYAGAHGLANDLDVVVEAANILKNESDVLFSFVGGGRERKRLMERAGSLGLSNVMFIEAQPKAAMPGLLAASDVCLAILKAIPGFMTTYPNKVFDYMASSKPTILAIDGVIREVIEKAGGGTFVPPGDASELAQAVLAYRDDPERVREEGASARKYVEEHFSRETQAAEIERVFLSLGRG